MRKSFNNMKRRRRVKYGSCYSKSLVTGWIRTWD